MTTQVVKLKMVEIDTDVQKRDGGSYKASQITYEVNGQTRTKAVHSNVVANNEELSAQLNVLADTKMPVIVELHTMKTDDGFVNLVGITPTTGSDGGGSDKSEAATSYTTNSSTSQSTKPTTSKKSSYSGSRDSSSKEESIVRAVALKAAVEFTAGKNISEAGVISSAEAFAEFLRGN